MATNELKTSKVRRLRGSASIREDGTFDFRPDGRRTGGIEAGRHQNGAQEP